MENNSNKSHTQSTNIQLICFRLGAETYGMDIIQIKEIIRHQKVTLVPKAPAFIEGVINLRGMVIPVIDLRKRFGLPTDTAAKNRIIITQIENKLAGFVVDLVTDIILLSKAVLMPPPEMVKGVEAEYLDGMADIQGELLFVVNIDKMLTADEKIYLDVPIADVEGTKVGH